MQDGVKIVEILSNSYCQSNGISFKKEKDITIKARDFEEWVAVSEDTSCLSWNELTYTRVIPSADSHRMFLSLTWLGQHSGRGDVGRVEGCRCEDPVRSCLAYQAECEASSQPTCQQARPNLGQCPTQTPAHNRIPHRDEFKHELRNLDFIQKGSLMPCDLSMHCVFDYWFMDLEKKSMQ